MRRWIHALLLGGALSGVVSGAGAARADGAELLFLSDRTANIRNSEIFIASAAGVRVDVARTPQADEREPVWSPDGRRLAFVRETGNDRKLVVAAADGGEERVLAVDDVGGFGVRWSPDGTRLAYVRFDRVHVSGGLAVVSADGSDHRVVAIGRYFEPTWSPDGRRLAFVDDAGASAALPGGNVHVVDADGTNHRALTGVAQALFIEPAWTADGARVTFKHRHFCTARSGVEQCGLDMNQVSPESGDVEAFAATSSRSAAWSPDGHAVAYVDDGKLFVVSSAGAAPRVVATRADELAVPAWSPDGSRLAFTRVLGVAVVPAGGGRARTVTKHTGSSVLWSASGNHIAVRADGAPRGVVHIVDVDSGRARTLRPNGLVEEFASVSWSPSAERLVFAATVVRNDQDLYRMGADGTHVRAVTHDAVAEQAPATSPDGRRIAFVLRGDVYVTRIDGSQRRRITRLANAVGKPTWSPRGDRIAFGRTSLERWEVAVVGAAGGPVKRVISGPTVYDAGLIGAWPAPAWSPDGRTIAYVRYFPDPLDECESRPQIFTVGLDGHGGRQITRERGYAGDEPAWAPDGRTIAFARSDACGGDDQIALVNSRGGRSRPLTGGGSGLPQFGGISPDWSPDGGRIAFCADGAIYVITPNGATVAQLTRDRAWNGAPDWIAAQLDARIRSD